MPTLNELLDVDLSFQEILEQLEEETEDFTILSGEVAFSSQFEFETAKSILENHYENVEEKGLDVVDGEGESAFTIEFSSPFVDDLDFPDEVEESFELRESDETNSMIAAMKDNDKYKDDPSVGSFWDDPQRDELVGVYSVLADDAPMFNSKLFNTKVRTGRKLHKDIWNKEQHKGKDKRFKGDHTLIPRGRVFQLEDGSFKVMVGDWIDEYPQCKDEVIYEFQLPKDTEFVKDNHWNIGRGFSDEFLED